MPSVYDDDAFESRVNYAATCAIRGTDSRHRDTCFEMWDGDYVVEALYRRVEKNPNSQLAACLWKMINRESALEAHERLKHIPRRKLAEEARKHRLACEANNASVS